ncbi:MAG: NADH-quinone oxidoreductase subunit C [Terracidiphilus sp.]
MTTADHIAETFGIDDVRLDSSGVQWFYTGNLGVRELAIAMKACRARFVTITAIELPGNEGLRLDYLWDLDGQLLGFSFHLETNSIESIFDICEATDWIEREIHEGFAVDFVGREYEPLLLREGNNLGVNLREVTP